MYLIFASVELLFIEFITVKKEDTMYLLFFICFILLCIFYHCNTASAIFGRVHLNLGGNTIF